VEEVTGVKIHKLLSGHLGGVQQVGAQIEANELDLVIFLRDPMTENVKDPNPSMILKLCDMHNIPFATNLATAELLILSLDRGDLDWREVGNPSI
jgi:methylglyoxal synthase